MSARISRVKSRENITHPQCSTTRAFANVADVMFTYDTTVITS